MTKVVVPKWDAFEKRKEREKKQDFEGRNVYLNYKKTNTKDKKKTQEEDKKANKLSTRNKS